MTNIKLINVYLEGFRACYYDRKSDVECPYPAETPKSEYWKKGHRYAKNMDNFLVFPTHYTSQ